MIIQKLHSPRIIFLALLVFYLFGCQSKSQKGDVIPQENQANLVQSISANKPIFQIDPRKFEENELNLADFAADVEYIPLSNKIRMGFIRKVKVTSKAIYLVSDKSSGGEGNGHMELFRFDKDGKNPVQIGRIGKGPREYLSSEYFAVDELNKRIYISGKLHTVLIFDTQGNYVRQFKFQNPEQRFARFEHFGDDKLFIPNQKRGARGPYLWSIIDTLGNVITSKSNTTPPFETRMGARSGTFKFKDKISYWVGYNDTIFTIAPDFSFEASYIISQGEHRKPKKDLPITLDLPVKLLEYYSPHNFMETNNYLISRYNYKGRFAYLFLDKKTHRTSISYFEWKRDVKGGIPNDFDNGLVFSPDSYFAANEDEYLAGTIQPFQLKAHVASDEFKNSIPKYPEKEKALEKLANSLNENDNPVLMLVKLK
jgi:hypothetical protein